MNFTPTSIDGAWLIELTPHRDQRGSFARWWCDREFAAHGIDARPVQANLAYNVRRGTLRGMHWQAPPHAEGKLVRCSRGAAYLVLLDLRESSPAPRSTPQSTAFELTAESGRQVWAPPGCAIGYQTLVDDTEISYLMSHHYVPEAGRGARYNDPALGLEWPLAVTEISAADRLWPDFTPS